MPRLGYNLRSIANNTHAMGFVDHKAADATAVSIITGFLGSGKTTLLNHLLAHPGMDQTVVLINEFGEVGLDHLLVKELDKDVVLLRSGCICCTVQGELVDGLKELYMKRLAGTIPAFRRVVIETTGLADPLSIISCLMRDPLFKHVYRLDGLITTVDAVYGDGQLNDHEEAVNQAAVADRLLITKTDLADAPTSDRLRQRLQQLNPTANVIPVLFGKVEPNALFDAGLFDPETKSLHVQRWLNDAADRVKEQRQEDHAHDHSHVNVNRHDEHISTFCLTLDEPVAWQAFKQWYEDLAEKRGDHILRVKGIVNIQGQDRPFAIHCVRSTQHAPTKLPTWPGNDRRSKIVFITRDLQREEIERGLYECLQAANDGGISGPIAPASAAQGPRERWLNDGELSRLFAVLADEPNVVAADAIRLMLLTGTRAREVLSATWEQFDLERRVWARPVSVLGESVLKKVSLGGPALALLQAMRARSPHGDWLFPGDSPSEPLAGIDATWRRATEAAAIEGAELPALRPSFAAHLFENLPGPVITRLLGLNALEGAPTQQAR